MNRLRGLTALLPPGLRPNPLGDGVWGRVAHRTDRAVHTYRRVAEGTARDVGRDPSEAATHVLEALRQQGSRLEAVQKSVTDRCVIAQREHPSAGLDVPGADDAAQVHRRLSRVGTLCAQAAQAATMARVALRSDPSSAAAAVAAVGRTVDQAVAEAGSPPSAR